MKVFLTSDLHFGHENIIKYCDRPYDSPEEMNRALIENWNSVVQPGDLVYNLGDLTMHRKKQGIQYLGEILPQLNGRHVLILGNHDYLRPFEYVELGIEPVHTSLVIGKFILAHDPAIATAIPRDMLMFCGHVHDTFRKLSSPKKILNVGCDIWDYAPIPWEAAVRYINAYPSDEGFSFEDLGKFGRHPK